MALIMATNNEIRFIRLFRRNLEALSPLLNYRRQLVVYFIWEQLVGTAFITHRIESSHAIELMRLVNYLSN